jgi:hypothetical protein
MFFDGAWRMAHSQKPHIDFYSHLGFLSYLPTLIGLKISGGSAWGFGYGQALSGLLVAAWSYWLGKTRLADWPLALLCVATTLMTVTPFALGYPLVLSPATTYNRLGYALLALCMVEAVAQSHSGESRAEFLGGFSTGVILAITLFLKITYFAGAVFLLLLLIPCRAQKKLRWAGIACGFTCLSLLCCFYFGFNLSPMLHDLLTVGGAKRIHWHLYLVDQILSLAIGVAVLGLLSSTLLRTAAPRRARSVLISAIVSSIAGVALIFGNAEESGFPLAAFFSILALNELLLHDQGEHSKELRFAVFSIGGVPIMLLIATGILGCGLVSVERLYLQQRLPPLHSTVLRGFLPAGNDFAYGEFLNDGLDLVARLRRPGETIMSLDFTNPFSYALSMSPAEGGTTVWQYETTFDDRFRPSAESLIGSASLVAVPKHFSDGSLEVNVAKLYGNYLASHFQFIGESRDWLLYRRKK